MLLWYVIIISFVLFWYIRLETESKFHSNDFVGLTQDFTIELYENGNYQENVIYIIPNTLSPVEHQCLQDIPEICEWQKRHSIECLALIKEKWTWYYNKGFFKPSDKNCIE